MSDLPSPTSVDVSVIVIVYNDAARLPTAVRSVLRQSLRSLEVIIVDDASTDETPQVAQELAVLDPRVRYVRLPRNSGGCGAPRNAGLGVARAPHVMFLDSDDRYERHACKNLLEAVEDTGADFAMGLARRENMDTRVQTLWYPQIFRERRVVAGLEDCPGIVRDTISVNKLYRRSFLDEQHLRFPEDVHYEDQLFTYQAYHRATAIAVIPENVYIWRIFPSHESHSISHQRHQIDNFHHRLEVNRRLDEYIRANASGELRLAKDLKFLQHDMRLYLEDVIDGDRPVSAEVLREAAPYLRTIPLDRYERLPTGLRAAYGMALRQDIDGVRGVMLFDRQNIVAGRIREHEGRWYWSAMEAEPGPDARFPLDSWENRFLDITGSSLAQAPVTSYSMLHELTSIAAVPKGFQLTGTTFDGLGKLSAGRDWTLTLVVKPRGGPDQVRVPLRAVETGGGRLTWSAELTVVGDLFSLDQDARWDLEIEVQLGTVLLRQPLRWSCADTETWAAVPGVLGRAFSDRVRLYRTQRSRVGILTGRRDRLRFRVGRRLHKRVRPGLQRRVVKRWKALESKRLRYQLYAAMRRLPLDPRLAVFEAHLGTTYGDSPKYVYEELRRVDPTVACVWVLPPGRKPPDHDVRVVRRGSYGYLWTLARATYLVDNQTFPRYFRKRPGQRYLQTWHGIPLKRMGIDIADASVLQKEERGPDRGVGAWDQLVVPNEYFEEVFVPAFRFTGELVRYGTPRNDPLVTGALDRDAIRRRLDIPADRRIVLYAPTFRQNHRRTAITVPFDVESLVQGLGPGWTVLLRAHYLNRVHVPGAVRTSVVDVSAVEDVNDLYAVADVLVTDYSSVMFDYALLKKPIVFYTYDYEQYLGGRGVYFDLRSVGPGPFVETTEELVAAVAGASGSQDAYADRYETFLKAYCGREDGRAAHRAVLALLGRRDRR